MRHGGPLIGEAGRQGVPRGFVPIPGQILYKGPSRDSSHTGACQDGRLRLVMGNSPLSMLKGETDSRRAGLGPRWPRPKADGAAVTSRRLVGCSSPRANQVVAMAT